MVSKLISLACLVTAVIVSVNCLSMPYMKDKGPILIKSVTYRKSDASQAAQAPRHVYYAGNTNRDRDEYYGSSNENQDNEKGQILHRPKNSDRNGPKSQQLNNNDDGPGPVILNGRGKAVKYVPSGGNNQGGPNNRPPQVYVISGGDDEEEDQGMMGSMQSYFKSMTGRIKSVMKGFIGSSD